MDAFSYHFSSLRNNYIIYIILLDCIHMWTNDYSSQKINSFKYIKILDWSREMARGRNNSRFREKMIGSPVQIVRGANVDSPESTSTLPSPDDSSTALVQQPINNLTPTLVSQTDNAYVWCNDVFCLSLWSFFLKFCLFFVHLSYLTKVCKLSGGFGFLK